MARHNYRARLPNQASHQPLIDNFDLGVKIAGPTVFRRKYKMDMAAPNVTG